MQELLDKKKVRIWWLLKNSSSHTQIKIAVTFWLLILSHSHTTLLIIFQSQYSLLVAIWDLILMAFETYNSCKANLIQPKIWKWRQFRKIARYGYGIYRIYFRMRADLKIKLDHFLKYSQNWRAEHILVHYLLWLVNP